jgi:hypothetical protein
MAPKRKPMVMPTAAGRFRDGCTEAIILAHGFTVEQMLELVRARLATATSERVVARARAARHRGPTVDMTSYRPDLSE